MEVCHQTSFWVRYIGKASGRCAGLTARLLAGQAVLKEALIGVCKLQYYVIMIACMSETLVALLPTAAVPAEPKVSASGKRELG